MLKNPVQVDRKAAQLTGHSSRGCLPLRLFDMGYSNSTASFALAKGVQPLNRDVGQISSLKRAIQYRATHAPAAASPKTRAGEKAVEKRTISASI